MLNEPASSVNDEHFPPRQSPGSESLRDESLYERIRTIINPVFAVHDHKTFVEDERVRYQEDLVLMSRESRLLIAFYGELEVPAEIAYEQLDAELAPYDLLPVFRQDSSGQSRHAIYILQGRVKPRAGGGWLSAILFILTVCSVLYVGTIMAINELYRSSPFEAVMASRDIMPELWRGMPYAVSILLILGGHELGHYFLARYHRTAASLPYFLPFPFGIFGTFGAAIRLREPLRNRKILFDVGVAGPIAGLVFAVPILFVGLATSDVLPMEPGLIEGNSIFYAISKILVFGRFLPDGEVDVYVNQLAWAGWTGLLITGLNLIPVGQLDGGHVVYALLGKNAQRLFYPVLLTLLLLTVFVANELLVFVILIALMGNRSATPLEDISNLDSRRRRLAISMLVVFVLVFVPAPLTQSTGEAASTRDGFLSLGALAGLPVLMATLWLQSRNKLTR